MKTVSRGVFGENARTALAGRDTVDFASLAAGVTQLFVNGFLVP